MGRLALTVSYDGALFAGAQVQPGKRTVQGEIEAALARLFGGWERVVLAGRTDRGVHAAGQVAGCADRRPDWSGERLGRALNGLLPPDVAITRVDRRAATFHARYDARWREYRYRIWTGGRAPLARGEVWERTADLDLESMRSAAAALEGVHDFASFAGGGQGVPWSAVRDRPRGTERNVLVCDCRTLDPWWGPAGEGTLIEIRVVADGFLPRMVRSIAAALAVVGRGDRAPEWLTALLLARDRRVGAAIAPPHGLTLWRVGYGDDDPGAW